MVEKEDVVKVPVFTDCVAVSRVASRLGMVHEALLFKMKELNIYATPYDGKMYLRYVDVETIERTFDGA